MSLPVIRPACVTDLARICEIYRPYVLQTTITFEETPPDLAEMTKRFEKLVDQGFPYDVMVKDDQIIGYGYIGPFHHRCAYRYTVEHSLYLDPKVTGHGWGRMLLEHLIHAAKEREFKQLIAVIAGNEPHASHHLHQKLGFVEAGRIQKCGFKFDQWIDVTYMQKGLA